MSTVFLDLDCFEFLHLLLNEGKSQNTENVISQQVLPKKIASDVSWLHQSGPGSSCALHLLIWGVMQQSVHETKTHDIDDLQETLDANLF